MNIRRKRYIILLKMVLSKISIRGGGDRARILRESGLFHFYGNCGAWHSMNFPSEPWLVSVGNNVVVAADVKMYTHDVCHRGLNGFAVENGLEEIQPYLGKIVIGNNVVIGADSIILSDIEIGDNVIIGAGSVVTRSVSSGNIVAGNPARVIGSIEDLYHKRRGLVEGRPFDDNLDIIKQYFWN